MTSHRQDTGTPARTDQRGDANHGRPVARHLSLEQARRIAIAAQGLHLPRPSRPSATHVVNAIRRLGLLQYDSVNVLVQAHYLVLFSRLGGYSRRRLDDLIYRERRFTEHWAHEASIIPIEDWPLLEYRRRAHRVAPWGFEQVLESNPQYVELVLDQVRRHGPLAADQLPDCEGLPRKLTVEWFRTVPRATLEAHFGWGTLSIANRQANMAREYDLTERVIPEAHRNREVAPEFAHRRLVLQAARALGVATTADLADYYRMTRTEASAAILNLVASGDLLGVTVEGWRGDAWLHPKASAPRSIATARILSPFDPLVWYRPRLERLFDFEYRIEIYTPKEKRRWGYYVLPFLFNDRLVARVDLRADRPGSRLVVESIHWEPGVEQKAILPELRNELSLLASWLDLKKVGKG